MSLPAGSMFGPYELQELIGSGGMGNVFRARDTRLEREVAVKLVSDSYLGSTSGSGSHTPLTGTPGGGSAVKTSSAHARFLREARSAAMLNHPNICAIYDTGEQDGRAYLVMELLRGETLKQYMAGKALQPAEVVSFAAQAMSALAAAHEQNIIHRDIKPSNIFVVHGSRGRNAIKILDFGLAKKNSNDSVLDSRTSDATGVADHTLTSAGSAIGTVAYMSPEQARGETLDARTDLFSMGAVIYEMATGRSPFPGNSPAEIFAALLTKNPAPIRELNPEMPAGLEPIVARLLAKDPAERYANAEQALGDLEQLQRGETQATGTVDRAIAAARPAPAAAAPITASPAKNKTGIYAVAAVIVLIAVAAGAGWWFFHRAPATPPTEAPLPEPTSVLAPSGKDSIILADFTNKTGDPVFDTTLDQALQISLAQSPKLDIVSQQHLRQSVHFLGKPDGTPITPDIARELAVRQGIKAVIAGTVARLGNSYVVTLTAQNAATGDDIATEQATASDKDHVLDALSKAAAAMRGRLGEDLASIKRLNTPFGQATTPSLEAFRAYALGDDAHVQAHDIPEAEGHYERAIELDPNFAMAYARLGVVYINSGQVAKANDYFTKAFELSKNVSERERLYIAGHYYENVTGDISKAIETLQEALTTYPGQLDSLINIGVAYMYIGKPEEALPYTQQAVKLAPDDAIASENLADVYLGLNRPADALAELRRGDKIGLFDGTSSLAYAISIYYANHDPAGIQSVLQKVAGRPDEFIVLITYGLALQDAGRFHEASEAFRRAQASAERAKAPDVAASALYYDGLNQGFAGACADAPTRIHQALALDSSKQTQELVSMWAATCGEIAEADKIISPLAKKWPQDTLVQGVALPYFKTLAAVAQGNPRKGMEEAEAARAYFASYPNGWAAGQAALAAKDSAVALAAFQQAEKARSWNLAQGDMMFYVPAIIGQARAYALAGDKANAKATYQRAFDFWKNADPDIPLLIAAKKEYAAL